MTLAVAGDFDNEHKRISEKINEIKKAKLKFVRGKKQADNYKRKLTEMDTTLKTVRPQVREFDEDLVIRLINIIKKSQGFQEVIKTTSIT